MASPAETAPVAGPPAHAPPSGRLRILDSLRGIAALSVVLFHMTKAFDSPDFFPGYPKAIYSFSAGSYGVWLFFVISGFVILWTIGRAHRWRDFGISRFARLYPPFWASLILVTVVILLVQAEGLGGSRPFELTLPQFLANATMVPQWLGYKPIDGVYWTLTIEMGFYILISLMFVAKLLRRDRIVWAMTIFWFIDIVVFSALTKASGSSLRDISDFSYLFIAGMAYFLLWEGVARPRWLLWALFVQMPFVDLLRGHWVVVAIDVAILLVVHFAVSGKLSFLEWAPFLFLGRISYSLYLVHSTLGYLTQRWLLEHGVERNLAVVLTVAGAIGLAVVFNKVVERRVSPWVRNSLTSSKPEHRRSDA